MGVKQRYQEADYLNVGGASTEEWALMGTGFSKIDDSRLRRQPANVM